MHSLLLAHVEISNILMLKLLLGWCAAGAPPERLQKKFVCGWTAESEVKQADGASPKPKAALVRERRRDLIVRTGLSEIQGFFCGNSGDADRAAVLIINRDRKPRWLFRIFMKIQNIVTAGLSIALLLAASKYIPDLNKQNQVKQLLETKQCPECNLSNVNLKGMDLQGFNLQGANLEGANLSGAKLANANLKNANLNKANLTGADLGCAGITFNLDANEEGANMDFKVSAVPEKNNPDNAVVGFNMKATERGATMRFNLMGCADFENARLQETKMPDGKIHP